MFNWDDGFSKEACWHEAGHAVAAIVLGHGAKIEAIEVDKERMGNNHVVLPMSGLPAEHRGIIALAGEVSVHLTTWGRQGQDEAVDLVWRSQGSDGDNLRAALSALGGDHRQAAWRLESEAYRILRERENWRIKLAQRLERDGSMTGAEVRGMFGIPEPPAAKRAIPSPPAGRAMTAPELRETLAGAEKRGLRSLAAVLRGAIDRTEGAAGGNGVLQHATTVRPYAAGGV